MADSDSALLEPLLLEEARGQGWSDERWTRSRVRVLIADRLGIFLSIRGVWELLLRHNWSCQQPVRRAVERDDAAVAGWLKETWAPGKATSLREISWSGWARTTAWPLCSREDFDDEFGDLLYAADWYVVSGGGHRQ
ncbi:winged helix-turn-helix domain-containing protein [Streptomyces sp. NPDC005279]|uniref:helix-turn-helix domain-containing protein n=1 Tax=Streptomyces sp. NPDC005279 TaxID=3364712 RepID=UPI0036754AC6